MGEEKERRKEKTEGERGERWCVNGSMGGGRDRPVERNKDGKRNKRKKKEERGMKVVSAQASRTNHHSLA